MQRILISAWVCVAMIATVSDVPAAAAGAQDNTPNILLIIADDVGQEVLGCYGGESYPTPHLDELARTGMQFRHAYSMPVCHPTRLTLMTGQYPFRHGPVTWGDFPAEQEAKSFPRLLQQAGYQTAIAGKWQLTLLRDDPQHPQRLGFGHWDLFGWHEGPRYYEPLIYHNGKIREDTLGHYGPDLYVRSLIQFMRQNRERPFLACYSMAVCHEVTDDLEEPVPHGPFGRYDSYAEMVVEMDQAVGRMVAALNALDLRQRTLILFVADNGTPQELIVRAEGKQLIKEPIVSRQNGRDVPGGKGTLLNTGTQVPLIANWPGTIQPGQVVDDLVDVSDFYPTVLDLAQVPLSENSSLDGISFAARLRDGSPSSRQWAYSEEAVLPKPGGTEPAGDNSGLRWVRNADWKLYNDGRLFDMRADPREQQPLNSQTQNQAARKARQTLQQVLADLD